MGLLVSELIVYIAIAHMIYYESVPVALGDINWSQLNQVQTLRS